MPVFPPRALALPPPATRVSSDDPSLLTGRVYDRYNLGYYGPDETGASASTTAIQAWLDYLNGGGMTDSGNASDFTSEGRVPQGLYLSRTVSTGNLPMIRGAGSRLTAFRHADGFTEKLFRFTTNVGGAARDDGGLVGIAFYGGTHTEDLVYFDGAIDSNVLFHDLAFDQYDATAATSVATNGISVKDYVNWHLSKVRCNRLRGWWLLRRDTDIGFAGSSFSITGWSYDNELNDGASTYNPNGRGMFRASVADTNNSFKGTVHIGPGKFEINDPLCSVSGATTSLTARNRALIYLLQNSTRAGTNGIPQWAVSLDAVSGIGSSAMGDSDREFRLVGCDVGSVPIHFAACRMFGVSELMNNDAGDAAGALVGAHNSDWWMNGAYGRQPTLAQVTSSDF